MNELTDSTSVALEFGKFDAPGMVKLNGKPTGPIRLVLELK